MPDGDASLGGMVVGRGEFQFGDCIKQGWCDVGRAEGICAGAKGASTAICSCLYEGQCGVFWLHCKLVPELQELGYVICLAEAEEAVIGVGPWGGNGARVGWQQECMHG
eukprot:15170924-Ditylum_brightwellii.AAC.1